MRVSRLMGLAVVLVALAAAINALAFKTATVTNPTTITVAATNAAGLAMDVSGSPGAGVSTTVSTNAADPTNERQLTVSLSESMQPGSTYRFVNVFNVKNNSSGGITSFTVDTTAFTGLTVALYQSGSNFGTLLTAAPLASGANTDVDMEITVPAGYAGTGTTNAALKITANK